MTFKISFNTKMYFKVLLIACVVVTLIPSAKSINFNVFNFKRNSFNNANPKNYNDDATLSIQQLASKFYYNLEDHKVITEDGYKLTVHRFGNNTKNGIPILLMHGLMDSADTWILQGSNSLGHILADQGFDVWLGNARGNKYCLSHVNLTESDQKFWNFTWEEIGIYDLPATIDYILNVTDKNALYYVGHSQGTTSFFVMNSLKPEYNKKIKMMFALAPVAWMKNIENPILRYISKYVISYSSFINIYSPSTNFLKWITNLCAMFSSDCGNVWTTFIGSDNGLIDKSFQSVIFGHFPTSSSALQLIHYGQLINSGHFCRFDHGVNNFMVYGTNTPPDYNLSSVSVPVVLFYSNNDKLSHPMDVSSLYEHLPNVFAVYDVSTFNHFDYMYAKTAKDVIYFKILSHIRNLEDSKF